MLAAVCAAGWRRRKHRDAGVCAGVGSRNLTTSHNSTSPARRLKCPSRCWWLKAGHHAVGSGFGWRARKKIEVIAGSHIFYQWNFQTACAQKYMREPAWPVRDKAQAQCRRVLATCLRPIRRAHGSARACFCGFLNQSTPGWYRKPPIKLRCRNYTGDARRVRRDR